MEELIISPFQKGCVRRTHVSVYVGWKVSTHFNTLHHHPLCILQWIFRRDMWFSPPSFFLFFFLLIFFRVTWEILTKLDFCKLELFLPKKDKKFVKKCILKNWSIEVEISIYFSNSTKFKKALEILSISEAKGIQMGMEIGNLFFLWMKKMKTWQSNEKWEAFFPPEKQSKMGN